MKRNLTPAPKAAAVSAPVEKKAPALEQILLVEDDVLIRADTAEFLREMGHSVIDVSSGEEALVRLKSTAFDLLFTDVGLPGISGIELAKQARAESPALAVVFATGRDSVPDIVGPVPVLLGKPYTSQALEAAVAAALKI